jgi:mono/diheme cytochrome c family protein
MNGKTCLFAILFISPHFIFAQLPVKASIANGKVVYEKNCLTCHQANGGGVPHMNPPLINASFVNGGKDTLIRWVLSGSTAKVPIDGKYYSNNMPAQAGLKDKDIADVLTYIRSNFNNHASPVTVSDVRAVRRELKK